MRISAIYGNAQIIIYNRTSKTLFSIERLITTNDMVFITLQAEIIDENKTCI